MVKVKVGFRGQVMFIVMVMVMVRSIYSCVL